MIRALVLGAIVTALLLTTAQAQVMRQFPLTCDLMVNGHRISFPPNFLSLEECDTMKTELQKKDKTDAKLKCKCEVGGRT